MTVGNLNISLNGARNWAASWFPRENENRKNLLNQLEVRLANPNEGPVAKLYCRELKERITATKKTENPAAMCRAFAATSRQYQDLVRRVEAAVFSGTESFYEAAMKELETLKNLPITETEKSIYIGRITKAFRELDNAGGFPRHRFCGCHILEAGKPSGLKKFTVSYPSAISNDPALQGRAAVLQSWSIGGGHDVAQRGMAQRLAEVGMHAYNIEAYSETLRPFDTVRNITGGRYCDADAIGWLMRKNCWNVLRFINWAFSGKPAPQKYQAIMDQFMRSILARGAPELHMTIFARTAGAAANAAGQLGVADTNVMTDLLSDYFDIQNPSDVTNPHFYNAAMAGGEKLLKKAETALPGRTVVTGFPVQKAFLENYDIDALRRERGIAPDARVVILSSGGEGIENGYAEYIVNQYEKNPNGRSKIHLFVLCGRNKTKKPKLDKEFAALKNPRITAEALPWVDGEELGGSTRWQPILE